MCGIIGTLGAKVEIDWVKEGLSQLSHRGPDSNGIKIASARLIMGSTRLAMTDPVPRSNQPMVQHDSGNVLIFNGEIYNYRELRNELTSQGIQFQTNSDTEVLLEFLGFYGINQINRLNGMFSFAFFNNNDKTLTLARDRLGKKPLYLAFCHETLFWSSEITPLRNLSIENKINIDFIDEYLSLGYLLDPTSPIKGVTSMLPGQILTFSTENLEKPVSSILEKPRPAKSLAEQDIRETIFTAVKQRIEGHESVALSLSGGLDSTIIGILLSEMDVEVNAYSVNWPDSDKSRYNTDALVAEKIANKLGINFVKVDMVDSSHITSELDKFISIMQEPNNNPSGLSMNKLYSEISKRGDRLVLTGDGSDEIFGGYQRYSSAVRIPKIFSFNGRLIEQSLLFNKRSPMREIGNLANSQINPNNISTWLNWHMVFSPREINELLFPNHKPTEVLGSLKLKIKSIMSNPEYINRTESIMDRDQNIWLTMESNRKLDRISMAYSIEARSPFQDDNVIYCAGREMKEKEFKKLDKEILQSVFPELRELGVRIDKAGFTSPVGHWLRNNDLLVRESLNDLVKSGMFDVDRLNQFNDVPLRGKYRELMQLWTLVVLARYLKQNRNE